MCMKFVSRSRKVNGMRKRLESAMLIITVLLTSCGLCPGVEADETDPTTPTHKEVEGFGICCNPMDLCFIRVLAQTDTSFACKSDH